MTRTRKLSAAAAALLTLGTFGCSQASQGTPPATQPVAAPVTTAATVAATSPGNVQASSTSVARQVAEDSPEWDACTMGNRSGTRPDGTICVAGEVVAQLGPLTDQQQQDVAYLVSVLAPPTGGLTWPVLAETLAGYVSGAIPRADLIPS